MPETIQRSQEVQEFINTIREDAVSNKEAAQLGRMELLFKNASVLDTLFNALEQDPHLERKDLLNLLTETVMERSLLMI